MQVKGCLSYPIGRQVFMEGTIREYDNGSARERLSRNIKAMVNHLPYAPLGAGTRWPGMEWVFFLSRHFGYLVNYIS
jgi:hypothetical protein